MNKYQRAKWHIKNTIIVLMFLLLLLLDYILCYSVFSIKMKPKSCGYICYIEVQKPTDYYHKIGRDMYIDIVNKEFNVLYWVTYSDYISDKSSQLAKTNILTRHITMSYKLLESYYIDYDYEKALVHEIMHLKYNTINETYVTYKAITELLESNNSYLRYIGAMYANDVLEGGYYECAEDCSYELVKYCNEHNIGVYYA